MCSLIPNLHAGNCAFECTGGPKLQTPSLKPQRNSKLQTPTPVHWGPVGMGTVGVSSFPDAAKPAKPQPNVAKRMECVELAELAPALGRGGVARKLQQAGSTPFHLPPSPLSHSPSLSVSSAKSVVTIFERSQPLRDAPGRKIMWRVLTIRSKNLRGSGPGQDPVKNPNK